MPLLTEHDYDSRLTYGDYQTCGGCRADHGPVQRTQVYGAEAFTVVGDPGERGEQRGPSVNSNTA